MNGRVNSVATQKAAVVIGPAPAGVLQRQCACGRHTQGEAECGKCAAKRATLQRHGNGAGASNGVPSIVNRALMAPGHSLDAQTRGFMEPRFGHDFSSVRVHTDSLAGESARSVNALAYTLGSHVVFGAGQYAPHSAAGRRLLAHELTHVVQQRGQEHSLQGKGDPATGNESALTIGQPADSLEREADRVSAAVTSETQPRLGRIADAGSLTGPSVPAIQRKMVVNPTDDVPLPPGMSGPPDRLTNAVRGLLGDTCPEGKFNVDMTTGNVTPGVAGFCTQPPPKAPAPAASRSTTPAGCECICDVIGDAQTTTIAFHAGGPGTSPGSVAGAGPGQGGVKTSPTVHVDPRFQGQYLINGKWVDIPFHLIFSHELCGHALPKMKGTHAERSGNVPAGGTPDAEQHAVDVERQIAAEHNPPLPRRPDDYGGAARQKP